MNRFVALSVIAGTALSVGLAGCTTTDQKVDAASGSVPAIADAPLTSFMNDVYGLGSLSEAEKARQQEQSGRIEAQVAGCMKAAGFDYTPVTSTAPDSIGRSDAVAWDMDSRELVEKYGYGFVASPVSDGTGADPTPIPQADVNGDYRNTLTSSEQAAYDDALYRGVGAEDGASTADPGCLVAAREDILGTPQDIQEQSQFQPLFDAVNAFYGARLQWTGMAELEGAWASCMSGRGYPGYTRESDARDEIGVRLAQLRQKADSDGVTVAPADLDALADDERTVAVADLECRQDSDYTSRLSTLWYAAESQFIVDHQTDIDAARAWLDQATTR